MNHVASRCLLPVLVAATIAAWQPRLHSASTTTSHRSVSGANLRLSPQSQAEKSASSGSFVEAVSVSDPSARSSSAAQDSTVTFAEETVTIIGSGSASDARPSSAGASQVHRSESALLAEFSLPVDSFYSLAGSLKVAPEVQLPGPSYFDDSFSSIELSEASGGTLFGTTLNGAFSRRYR